MPKTLRPNAVGTRPRTEGPPTLATLVGSADRDTIEGGCPPQMPRAIWRAQPD